MVALAVVAAACTGTAERPDEIRLMTHDSFFVSEGVLEAFTAESGLEVTVLRAGDAGEALSRAIITKDNPIADVLFGVDNTFLSRALAEGLFLPYESPQAGSVPDALRLDPAVTPIDFGDVCLNYDKAAFTDLEVPATLADLTRPEYRGMTVVEDPSTSSPGLAFLLATIASFGDPGWQDYWRNLRANDVLVTSGWEEAYFSYFSGASDGDRPLVVSYASSPPAAILADPTLPEAPTAVITDGCFRQIEFAGILAGSEGEEVAGELIDFMLSPRFQEDIPLNMFVFPAIAGAALPPEFVEHTVIPETPATLDPQLIEDNRNRWIEEWTEIVLR